MRRRDFLKGTTASLLVLPHWARGAGPNDQIAMGIIGTGGMGGSHVNWFLSHKDVRIDAICDVDDHRAAQKLKIVHQRYKNTAATSTRDFREVLDRKDIDAISTATPDHWHALIVCHAFQAGKDAYAEKPLAHNVREAQAMLALGTKGKRVFQLGTQIHAGDNYHRVVELVRSGKLGKIHTVRVWKSGGSPNIAKTPGGKPPAHFDYDRWLGPAPVVAYHPKRCHFSFRYFQDYSFGNYADFWCHISDIAFWALELGSPTSVVTRGELQTKGMSDTPNRLDMDLEFPDLKYFWTTARPKDAPGKVGGGIGAWFIGDKGSLVTEYSKRAVYIDGKELPDLPDVPKSVPRSPGHQRNFLDCVKSRKLTESNLPYAVTMTTPMFLGRISLLLGRPLKWDAAKQEIPGDAEANALLGRPWRKPWIPPGCEV